MKIFYVMLASGYLHPKVVQNFGESQAVEKDFDKGFR